MLSRLTSRYHLLFISERRHLPKTRKAFSPSVLNIPVPRKDFVIEKKSKPECLARDPTQYEDKDEQTFGKVGMLGR